MPSNAVFDSTLRRCLIVLVAAIAVASIVGVGSAAAAKSHNGWGQPDFGPNVVIFDPSMPTSQIQATVDAIANQQVSNQFGTQRYALLFKPGTYGTAADPLNFQVGYYTDVAGLGASPNDVVINGSDRRLQPVRRRQLHRARQLLALAVEPDHQRDQPELRLPHRRVLGRVAGRADASRPRQRAHHADGLLHRPVVRERRLHRRLAVRRQHRDQRLAAAVAGQEQQPRRLVERRLEPGVLGRRRRAGAVLPGAAVVRRPVHHARDQPGDARGAVPLRRLARAATTSSCPRRSATPSGTTWASGPTPGPSIPIDEFFIAKPTDSAADDQQRARPRREPDLHSGRLPRSTGRSRSSAPTRSCSVSASRRSSPTERRRRDDGRRREGREARRADVRRRPGELAGAAAGGHRGTPHKSDPRRPDRRCRTCSSASAARRRARPTTSLVVNSDNVILDDIWAWRADHGNGVGWTANTADTGVIVNGDNVTAYGLFVEHYQKYEVIWNGENGKVVFFQNEMPYDPPSQAAWMEAPGVDGWAAFKVADNVTQLQRLRHGQLQLLQPGRGHLRRERLRGPRRPCRRRASTICSRSSWTRVPGRAAS